MKGLSLAIETVIIIILAVLALVAVLAFFAGIWPFSTEHIIDKAQQTTWCTEYTKSDKKCDGSVAVSDYIVNNLTVVCKGLSIKDCCSDWCAK